MTTPQLRLPPAFRFAIALSCAFLTLGCEDDPTRPGTGAAREYAIVVNSVSLSLTVFPSEQPDSSFSIALGPEGSPVAVAARGATALVPLGVFPGVAVVDLRTRTLTRTLPMPLGSTPTGVAIVDDSLAFVTLSTADAVIPILYDRGAALDPIPTGVWPEAVLHVGGTVYVLNTRFDLDPFGYQGPGTLTVIDAASLDVIDTVDLTGTNPGAALAHDGSLWVLNRGDYGAIGGSLSQVDRTTRAELDLFEGFGAGPGGLAVLEDEFAIAAFTYGIALWDPDASAFSLSPANGFRPDSTAAVADVGVSEDGHLYIVDAQCASPGGVFVVDAASFDVVDHVNAGVCPFDITFTRF